MSEEIKSYYEKEMISISKNYSENLLSFIYYLYIDERSD